MKIDWKRVFDVILALILLVPDAIVVAVLYLAVRLTSHGPGIFRQQRVGIGGQKFTIYKLRTMVYDPNAADFPCQNRHDPRVTPLGRWLRPTKLDELPQLYNVLIGNMSWVGPRPHSVTEAASLQSFSELYAKRTCTRPGVTGPSKLLGPISTLDEVPIDARYCALPWSPWRDLAIMTGTFWLVLGKIFLRQPEAHAQQTLPLR